jgi:hypothetical protein
MKFVANMVFRLSHFFHVLLFPFFIIQYIWLNVLYTFVSVYRLYIFIAFVFMYYYYYVYSVLYERVLISP